MVQQLERWELFSAQNQEFAMTAEKRTMQVLEFRKRKGVLECIGIKREKRVVLFRKPGVLES